MDRQWPVVGSWGTAHPGPPIDPLEPPPLGERLVRLLDAAAPAVVLGSAQCAPAGDVAVPFLRRRSGGGAVWVEPGDPVWLDVVVPSGDPLWDDDVGRAFWWLGECWVAALDAVGIRGGEVHRGPLVRSRWSGAVCFAGLGPGEVTVGGRKVVGMAQRRRREGALFQCAVPRAWAPARLAGALGIPDAVVDLTDVAMGIGDADVVPAFLERLP